MKKQKVGERYIVCNVDSSTHQRRFRIHRKFSQAVEQAQTLARKNPGEKFMVMEPIGGYVSRDGEIYELQVSALVGEG